MTGLPSQDTLLRRASRSMFWNATLLPLITAANLVTALVVRNYFGLASGRYDVVIGLVNSLMLYSALGLPDTIGQFTPGLESTGGRPAVGRFLRRVGGIRLLTLVALLIPVNLFAEQLADRLALGAGGVVLVHLATLLAVLRTANELVIKSLQALLRHFWANIVQLVQAVLGAAVLLAVLARGDTLNAVISGLIGVGAIVLVTGLLQLGRGLQAIDVPSRDRSAASPAPGQQQIAGFAGFMYLYGWLNYVVTPAFASPAIAAAAGDEAPVAIFNVALQLPMMVVVVMLAGFQGLYRPLFARLNRPDQRAELRTAFAEVSKIQTAILLPACTGLALLVDRYIPLMFGEVFAPAIPAARALCVLLMAESLLNLGTIILSVDRRYRDVVAAQGIRLLGVPVFIYFAARSDIFSAAVAFGAARFLSTLVGYLLARRRFHVRFPTAFGARAALATGLMIAALVPLRGVLAPTWSNAIGLTLAGAVTVAIGTRLFRVLGPRELDLLERTGLPGTSLMIRWLS